MAHTKAHRKAISRGLKAYHRRKGRGGRKRRETAYERKYTPAQRRAHTKSRTSKSGHKTWQQRIKDSKKNGGSAGLWANVHAKRAREKSKRR